MELRIGTHSLKSGEKKQGYITVINDNMKLPVTMLCGTREGPAVLISAGVHGAEYIGIQTALELARELEPEQVSGKLIFLHMANPSACYSFTRFTVPEDGKNLNRVFPGKKDGSLSERIAYTMIHKLYKVIDCCLDLHAGDISEQVMPFVYFPGNAGAEVVERSRAMARAADVAIRARSAATTGAYNAAAIQGIPAVLIERGGGGVFSADELALYKQDVRNILIHLGVLEGQEIHRMPQQEVNKATYIEAGQDGLWYPYYQAGELFNKGALLGELKDIWGNCRQSCYAEYRGIVMYQTVGLGVKEGDPLIAYGKPEQDR